MVAQIVFSMALLPSIFSKNKPALASSLVTGTFVLIIAFAFATLSLWLSTITSVINGTMWLILAFQKIRSK